MVFPNPNPLASPSDILLREKRGCCRSLLSALSNDTQKKRSKECPRRVPYPAACADLTGSGIELTCQICKSPTSPSIFVTDRYLSHEVARLPVSSVLHSSPFFPSSFLPSAAIILPSATLRVGDMKISGTKE